RHFDDAGALALEEGDAVIAMDRRQLRNDRRLEIRLVLARTIRRRARPPEPCDHGVSPMTTAHGRTCHRVTRPFVTYGSTAAKRSAACGPSPRNQSSAPPGGSPS